MNKLFEIATIDGIRGLIAKRNIEGGETILVEKAIAFCSLKLQTCQNCFKKDSKFRCSKCKNAYFCSASCQQQNFQLHKQICSKGNNLDSMYAQVCNFLTSNENSCQSLIFKTLEGDLPLRKGETLASLQGDQITKTVAIGIFNRNNFAMYNNSFGVYGEGCFPIASLMNHSCRPNSVPIFIKNVMTIKALSKIKIGEQIFHSYLDPSLFYDARRIKLHYQYHFTCYCEFCQLQEEIKSENEVLHSSPEQFISAAIAYYSTGGQNSLKTVLETSSREFWADTNAIEHRAGKVWEFFDNQMWHSALKLLEVQLSSYLLIYPRNHPVLANCSLWLLIAIWNCVCATNNEVVVPKSRVRRYLGILLESYDLLYAKDFPNYFDQLSVIVKNINLLISSPDSQEIREH